MLRLIEHAKNEDIARRAISIADYWLIKSENQAKHIQDLEARNSKQTTIEPKKGHWIKIHWKAFRCSECNKISEYFTDFCPNCGADMREGEAE